MSNLLKIGTTLVGIGCGITVCYVDRDIIVIAVGQIDVTWCGSSCGNFVVTVVSVDFDANVCVTRAIVKASISPATPAK